MMFPGKIRLTSFLLVSCLCIALLPLILYIILGMFTFGRGLDTVNRSILIKSIIDHASSAPIPDNIKIVSNRSLLPEQIKANTPEQLENGHLYRGLLKSGDASAMEVFFLISYETGGRQYLSYQIMPDQEAEIFIKPEVIQTLSILAAAALIILTAILFLVKYVVKKVLAPMGVLADWINTLSIQSAQEPLPQLVYPELYSIADFIKRRFVAEYEDVKSEEEFWKFCSHELRTPISVIRIGIEVLQKYVGMGYWDFGNFNDVLNRLKKSSHSMSSIIETILWINRKNGDLSRQKFDLANMVSDIIVDFKGIYLIDNSNLNVFTQRYEVEEPELAARIILENMIRNAFQHSTGEEICIVQIRNTVKVINKLMPEDLDSWDTGFGLGRELASRLAKKLGWEIKSFCNNQYNVISIKFT